ncbi:MAG: hypothetical protein RXO36_04050 [Candidatus Nanopusillus acidilobi]
MSDIWNIDVPKLFQSLFYRKVLIDNNNINFGTKEQKKYFFYIIIFWENLKDRKQTIDRQIHT